MFRLPLIARNASLLGTLGAGAVGSVGLANCDTKEFTNQQIEVIQGTLESVTSDEISFVTSTIDRDVINTLAQNENVDMLIKSKINKLTDADIENIKLTVSNKIENLISSPDPNVYQDIFHKLKLKVLSKSSSVRQSSNISSAGCANNEVGSWSLLSSKFKCCICLDVLAGPVILSCSHSFCGKCLWDHINLNETVPNNEIVSLCPECRSVFHPNRIIFERVLDQLIESEVEKINSSLNIDPVVSQEIYEWKKRRNAYLKCRNNNCTDNKHANGNSHDSDNDTIQYVSVLLMAVVIGMIIYLRS